MVPDSSRYSPTRSPLGLFPLTQVPTARVKLGDPLFDDLRPDPRFTERGSLDLQTHAECRAGSGSPRYLSFFRPFFLSSSPLIPDDPHGVTPEDRRSIDETAPQVRVRTGGRQLECLRGDVPDQVEKAVAVEVLE